MDQPVLDKKDNNTFLLKGVLTMQTVNTLARRNSELFADINGEITIDLSQVEHADSAGLALLIDWQRLARRSGFEVRFSHLPEQLMQIARVSELDKILPIVG